MRILSTIVSVFGPVMYGVWQYIPNSWYVATKTISHGTPGFQALAFQYSSKESFGGRLIATMLDHNFKNIAILINGPPQVVLLARD